MNTNYPRKGLFDTEERTVFCTTIGQNYHLSVALPESYATSNQAYPVIYLLDGDVAFGMAAGLTPLAHWLLGTLEVIVVGIGYDMESYAQWGQLRECGFKMPEVPDAPADSHANLFLDALTQEMIPFIEANYRTVPSDRCLYGYSSSGFFVPPCLVPSTGRLPAVSLWQRRPLYAYPYLIQHDERLAARHTHDPNRLDLSVGALEEFQFPFFDQLMLSWRMGTILG